MSTRFEKQIIMPNGKMGKTTLMDVSEEDRKSVTRWHSKEWNQFIEEAITYKRRVLAAAYDAYMWNREKCILCKKTRSMYSTFRKFKSRYHQRGSIMIAAAGNTTADPNDTGCTATASNVPNPNDFCLAPCVARTLAKLDNDGDWYWSEGSTSFGSSRGTWVGSCAVADYDGQFNHLTGSVPNYNVSGTDGVWQAMSTDLSVGYQVSIGVRIGTFDFKIRDGTTLDVLFTDAFSMSAEEDSLK